MSQQIVSIYTFELKKETSESQLLEASAKMDAILLSLPGFHYRSLTKTESGLWQDIVYWDSEECMRKADSLDTNKEFAAFMALIASHTVKHNKATLFSSVYPGMPIETETRFESA